MKNKKNNKKKGFTLIEILVAVIIIGVLAAIALPSYMRSMEKSKAANPITNLGSIAKAQNAYKLGTSHYTNNVGKLDISLKDKTNGEDADGSTFESEYFTYKVYGDDKAAATATRKNVDEDKIYELSVDYNTNKIYCRPIENKTCIDLNLEEGQDYNPQEDDSDWQDCSENLSAFASMIGIGEDYDVEELQAGINEYYPYCKIKQNEMIKVCGSDSGENVCMQQKISQDGCFIQSLCMASSSWECQGGQEFYGECYSNQNNVQLSKTCVDIDEDNFECNNWQNERLSWHEDYRNYWECEGDGIAPDGRSCNVYTEYSNNQLVDGYYHYEYCRINGECMLSEYSADNDFERVRGYCYSSSSNYGEGNPGVINANHTGCDSYAYYHIVAVNTNTGATYLSLHCENGIFTITNEDGTWYDCTANAQGNGCA